MRNLVFIEGDLKVLKRRLEIGKIVKGRIVMVLSINYYLLRLMGHNLVMHSRQVFKQGQEVYFKVIGVHPKIELKIFDLKRAFLVVHYSHKMNIII